MRSARGCLHGNARSKRWRLSILFFSINATTKCLSGFRGKSVPFRSTARRSSRAARVIALYPFVGLGMRAWTPEIGTQDHICINPIARAASSVSRSDRCTIPAEAIVHPERKHVEGLVHVASKLGKQYEVDIPVAEIDPIVLGGERPVRRKGVFSTYAERPTRTGKAHLTGKGRRDEVDISAHTRGAARHVEQRPVRRPTEAARKHQQRLAVRLKGKAGNSCEVTATAKVGEAAGEFDAKHNLSGLPIEADLAATEPSGSVCASFRVKVKQAKASFNLGGTNVSADVEATPREGRRHHDWRRRFPRQIGRGGGANRKSDERHAAEQNFFHLTSPIGVNNREQARPPQPF
jgi:hypothetical protein